MFTPHIKQLVKKYKLKLGFYFRRKSFFSFEARQSVVVSMFIIGLDYSDVTYMHVSREDLHMLVSVYQAHWGSLQVLKLLFTAEHCMHGLGGFNHWDILIYKVIVGLPPIYLYTYIHQNVWEVLGPKSYSFYLFQRFANYICIIYTVYMCSIVALFSFS